MFIKRWPDNFFQRPANPNKTPLGIDTAGKTKGELADDFSAIGVLPTTPVVIRKAAGNKFKSLPFEDVPDDATYLRRAAINFGRGHKGKTHAFQYNK